MLDDMDLERERGITIKSHPVTMQYTAADGEAYELNLIDTPGHVDFAYEVSRSMAACEGALLIVDAAQGVQAQTVANTYLAVDRDLEIIPLINKIDLPSADIPTCKRQIEDVLAIESEHAYPVSAKTGEGVDAVLEAIVEQIPPPQGDPEGKANGVRALVFDSHYDKFRGVVTYVRVVDGSLRVGDRMRFMASGIETELKEVGVFVPGPVPVDTLRAGQLLQGRHQQRGAGLAIHIKIAPNQYVLAFLDGVEEQARSFGNAKEACRLSRCISVWIEERTGCCGRFEASLREQSCNQRVSTNRRDQLG